MRTLALGLACLMALSLGCDTAAVDEADPPGDGAAQNNAPAAGQGQPAAGVGQPGQAAPEMVMERAGVGATGKGQYGSAGLITTPISEYFALKERIVFDIAIPQALQLFKAMDANGNGPKTHDEFMQRIIRENNIALPRLPEGHEYVYDPATEQLLVRHPK